MKLLLVALLALPALAQNNITNQWSFTTTNPSGSACIRSQAWVYMPSGALYTCVNGTATLKGGTSGTVTSVGLSLPSFITVSNSPVTSTGTLTGTLATQTANTVFSGPTTGAAAAPTFRTLVAADIPSLSATYAPLAGGATFTGGVSAPTYATATNCADSAGAAACGSAAAGSFVVDAAGTSTVVSTTAVTANSQIFVFFDAGLSTRLSVTCNSTVPALYGVTARTAGTSFTLTSSAPITNPACFGYFIVN